MRAPVELLELAQRQHGVLSRAQVVDAIGRGGLVSLERVGLLARTLPAVYRLGGAPVTFRQRAMASCLSVGDPVAVSHAAAAALHVGTAGPAGPVTVSVPATRSGRRRGVDALRRALTAEHVTARHGIPVTTAERTICDLAATWSPAATRHLVDRLLAARATTPASLAAVAEAPGSLPGVLRQLLAGYAGPDAGHGGGPDSVAEEELRRWLVEGGLPVPVRQHQVVVGGAVYLLDLAYPPWMVAIEYDGWVAHGTVGGFDRDRARTTELQVAGWLVVQVTRRHGRADTVGRIERALRSRGWAPGAGPGA